jgi:hypothetical protein
VALESRSSQLSAQTSAIMISLWVSSVLPAECQGSASNRSRTLPSISLPNQTFRGRTTQDQYPDSAIQKPAQHRCTAVTIPQGTRHVSQTSNRTAAQCKQALSVRFQCFPALTAMMAVSLCVCVWNVRYTCSKSTSTHCILNARPST